MGYYTRGNRSEVVNRYQVRQPYYRRSSEDIGDEMEQVEKQGMLLALEKNLEMMQVELRLLELEWLDERVTLDDILTTSMENSICHSLCVFRKK